MIIDKGRSKNGLIGVLSLTKEEYGFLEDRESMRVYDKETLSVDEMVRRQRPMLIESLEVMSVVRDFQSEYGNTCIGLVVRVVHTRSNSMQSQSLTVNQRNNSQSFVSVVIYHHVSCSNRSKYRLFWEAIS